MTDKLIPDYEKYMKMWDSWRLYISLGGRSSLPRDEFESMLDSLEERHQEILKDRDR